jgi:hypothetical protein
MVAGPPVKRSDSCRGGAGVRRVEAVGPRALAGRAVGAAARRPGDAGPAPAPPPGTRGGRVIFRADREPGASPVVEACCSSTPPPLTYFVTEEADAPVARDARPPPARRVRTGRRPQVHLGGQPPLPARGRQSLHHRRAASAQAPPRRRPPCHGTAVTWKSRPTSASSKRGSPRTSGSSSAATPSAELDAAIRARVIAQVKELIDGTDALAKGQRGRAVRRHLDEDGAEPLPALTPGSCSASRRRRRRRTSTASNRG